MNNTTQTPSDTSAKPLPVFPFTAICGQPDVQLALLLTTIDPLIGGVLIEGARGMAKSTSARALAELLPKQNNGQNGGNFINLPLGASVEQVIGTLDLQSALQDGAVHFRAGLLAQAHNGVLYVDEVNLLPDELVDVLLDVCASGVNHVERDGVSHTHAARFVLIGSMNPEEGSLRPQLLDRFGLCVRLQHAPDTNARQDIVRTRLAFDADPDGFMQKHHTQQQALAQRIVQAREQVHNLVFSDANHAQVAELCAQAQVDGVRADLVLLRAARAHAAWHHKSVVESVDIEAVMHWTLTHRSSTAIAPQQQQSADNKADKNTDKKGDGSGDGRPPQSNANNVRDADANQSTGSVQQTDNQHPSDAESNQADGDWGELLAPAAAQTPAIATLGAEVVMPVKKP